MLLCPLMEVVHCHAYVGQVEEVKYITLERWRISAAGYDPDSLGQAGFLWALGWVSCEFSQAFLRVFTAVA